MRGLKWIWLLVSALLLTGLYFWRGGATLLYLCLLLGLVICQGAFIVLFGPRSIQVERSWQPLQPKAGEPVKVTLRIKLSGGLTVPWLLIQDKLAVQAEGDSQDQECVGGSLVPGRFRKDYRVKYDITGPQRGIYGGEPIVISYGDFLGYFKRSIQVPMADTMYIHPANLAICPEEEQIAARGDEISQGSLQRLTKVSPFTEHIREYLPGDPLGRIYWKGAARTGTLLTRIPDERETAVCSLWLDTRHNAYLAEEEDKRGEVSTCDVFERSVGAAAMLLQRELARLSDRESGSDGTLDFRYGSRSEGISLSGQEGLKRGLDLLSGIKLEPASPQLAITVNSLSSRAGAVHKLITGRMTAEFASTALRLTEAGCKLEIWAGAGTAGEPMMEPWIVRLRQAGVAYIDLSAYLSARTDRGGVRHVSA